MKGKFNRMALFFLNIFLSDQRLFLRLRFWGAVSLLLLSFLSVTVPRSIKAKKDVVVLQRYLNSGNVRSLGFMGSTNGQEALKAATTLLADATADLLVQMPAYVALATGNIAMLQMYSVTVASTYALSNSLKHFVHRERPNHKGFHSFPSGHAVMCFLGLVFMIINVNSSYKKIIYTAIGGILSFLTMFCRVFAKYHYPSDVFVGAVIGVIGGIYIPIFFESTIIPMIKRLHNMFLHKQ